jgi:3,4-dihydroxy 2-butanone 4-phosphate synthase/GTP cyclohydrolase II
MRITLSYAQSLDGSIAARPGERTTLSGPAAMAYTHRLRAAHDAILVGVGTVVADNPRLTVRLAPGANPQPVVLDSQLRIPDTCHLLASPVLPLWIVCAPGAPDGRRAALEARGVRVLCLESAPESLPGRWPAIRALLAATGVRSLMVEGGARVIGSLLAAGCADALSVTIAPRFLNGLRALPPEAHSSRAIRAMRYEQQGDDIVLEAEFVDTP